MAKYAQLVARGLPPGVPVTIKQSGVQVPNLFPSANAQAPDNRPRTADASGALFPATYLPNGTYSVAWSGGSTSVTVAGATGLPAAIPFDMATQTELDASGAASSAAYSSVLPGALSAVTLNSSGDVTAWTEQGVAYTATYDTAGRVSTVSDGTTTRTVSYDTDDNVTAVA